MNKVIKIMPLGDSITEGYDLPGGYRTYLVPKLQKFNSQIKFIGSLQDGPPELLNADHEGHSGWRIDQIHDHIKTWLNINTPDIILLLIGTNDLVQNYQLSNINERLNNLINDIWQIVPAVTIFIATIPPINEPSINQPVILFNQGMQILVNQLQQHSNQIYLVDIYNALTIDDLGDFVHPNQQGHQKISQAWEKVLVDFFQSNN
ncbi:MAG: SGNH/GDSL hydrolase family protein [Microcoleaceae cyanobacterium]